MTALGYTPANATDVPDPYDDSEIRTELGKRSVLADNETVSGKKTFTYGTNTDPAIAVVGKGNSGAMFQCGAPTDATFSMLSFFRKCADDSNMANRGDVFVNRDGSIKIGHRRARAANTSEVGTSSYVENAAILIGHNLLAYQTSPKDSPTQASSDGPKLDIFYDTYETTKLNTTAHDFIGAINELNGKLSADSQHQMVKDVISGSSGTQLTDDEKTAARAFLGIDKDYILSLLDGVDLGGG